MGLSQRHLLVGAQQLLTPTVISSGRVGPVATSCLVTFSPAPTEGNLLLVFAGCPQSRTITMPAGWTRILHDSTDNITHCLFWKFAGAGEAANHTVTFSSSSNTRAIWFEITNVDTTSPFSSFQNLGSGVSATSNAAPLNPIQIPPNSLAIASWMLNTSTAGWAVTNSYGNANPGLGTNTLDQCVRKTYTAPVASQNVTASWTTSTMHKSIFILIKPKYKTV
jgi:hypothetical protein